MWLGFSVGFFILTENYLVLLIGLALSIGSIMQLAVSFLPWTVITLELFNKKKLPEINYNEIKTNSRSEKIIPIMHRYFMLGIPGSIHVVVLCTVGIMTGTVFKEFFDVVLVFMIIYSVLLNLHWILMANVVIKKKWIERQMS